MAKGMSIECVLPAYRTDRREWRQDILGCARGALKGRDEKWSADGPFEVVLLLYFTKGKQYDKHDVDNRLKDVLDALQGAFYAKVNGKLRAENRVIRNDRSVCRVIVEKQEMPKKYKNRPGKAPGGRLLVRAYKKRRWPLELGNEAR
jgi:Holliday junction resolvase RusA-like endonuclease